MYNSLQYRSGLTQEPTVTLGPQRQPPNKSSPSVTRQQRKVIAPSQQDPTQLRTRYTQQLQICHFQIQSLKQHIEIQENEKDELQQIIVNLKKELSAASKENSKLFQENERHRQLVEKLKIDNKSMEMEIDKFRGERKVYYNNLNNIEVLKRDIAEKMADKSTTLEEISTKYRKLERTHVECAIKMEELERALKEAQSENKELKVEMRSSIEKFLSTSNNAVRLQYELKVANEKVKNMSDKIYDLEKEREEIRVRFGSSRNENSLSQSNNSSYIPHQKSMVQIQSYMREIENLLDLKKDESERRKKNYDKLKISLECLQKNL